jgi:hypothetical protein
MFYEVTVNSFYVLCCRLSDLAYVKNLRWKTGRIGVPFSAEHEILTFLKVFLTKNLKANVKPKPETK